MDLTKIVLPTFILEKRSLLEMYADFLAHPDLFVGYVGTIVLQYKSSVAQYSAEHIIIFQTGLISLCL